MKKEDVRKIAVEKGLGVARKKDSTGICFVGDKGYSNFITEHVAADLLRGGELKLYPSGEVLAKHEGIHLFTYGQRKGLGVATGEPLYVLKIDSKTRDVWVGEEKYLYSSTAKLVQSRWLDDVPDGERLRIKIRYAHKGSWAKVRRVQATETSRGDEVELEFEEPVRAVTPGQAAVMYRGDQLVGGGWII